MDSKAHAKPNRQLVGVINCSALGYPSLGRLWGTVLLPLLGELLQNAHACSTYDECCFEVLRALHASAVAQIHRTNAGHMYVMRTCGERERERVLSRVTLIAFRTS